MKMLGALFIFVLFVGFFASTRAQALQVDCPFPEGVMEWQKAEERYSCKFAAAVSAVSPVVRVEPQSAVRQVSNVVVQQIPIVVVQTVPIYPYTYPFWGPLWVRQSLFYPDAYGYGWRPYLW